MQRENAKPGTTDWKLTIPGRHFGTIEGYPSQNSVNRGAQIKLFVHTAEPSYTIDIFRIGYYGGTGGRRMMPTITRVGRQQVMPTPDPVTGLVEADWIDPYILTIPASPDPTDWMSGVYVAKLTASVSGRQNYIMFSVRDDARASDLIYAQAITTDQAYNVWGGKSLYGTITKRSDPANKANKVSFNRPFYGDETSGLGLFPSWEHPFVVWLEKEGYDLTYATNLDVDRDPTLLLNHKAFLSIGHDEYWSWEMRDNVEAARDRGVHLGFFSANTSYWQVRFEPSVLNGDDRRTMVGYKENAAQDPITPTYLTTTLFRWTPVNRSEDRMIGVLFKTQARPIMVVEDASHWVLTGTGLKNGDKLANPDGTPFLGYEVDSIGQNSPANVQRITHSPTTPANAFYGDMTTYVAPSGATVFASGSIAWSTTIPQVQQITRNVLARFIKGAFADTIPERPPVPSPFVSQDIGTVGRAGFVSLAGPDSFTMNGAGGPDGMHYVHQQVNGNFEMVTRLTALQNFWDNRAGIMIRESLDGPSKYVTLLGRPSASYGRVVEGVEFRVRDGYGAATKHVASLDLPMPNWLKVSRSGNTFTSYASSDGSTWTGIGSFTVPMINTLYVGAAVWSAETRVWATAIFDNVRVSYSGPATDTTAPTVSITSPANGVTVSATTTVSATASDNVGVAGVQFRVDGVNVGAEDTTAPYSYSWNTTTVSNGVHLLTTEARDAAGNKTVSAAVSVTVSNAAAVDTTPPVVAAFDANPKSGPAPITASFTITDTGGSYIKLAELWRAPFNATSCNDSTRSGCAWARVSQLNAPATTNSWSGTITNSPAAGTYFFGIHAIDNAGRVGYEPAVVKVVVSATTPADTTPPLVSVTSPANGATVSGSVSLSAAASDNVGVVGVQFKVNGANVGAEDTAVPYSATWNTTSLIDGSYTITAEGRDAAGNRTTSGAVIVAVDNDGAPPSSGQCSSVTLSKTTYYSGTNESNWTVTVTAPTATCTWNIVTSQPWIVVVSTTPAPPAGNGSFRLRVLSNTTGAARFGTFTIAGTVYKVSQE